MSNVLKSLLTFILGWVLLYLFIRIFGGYEADNLIAMIFTVFYLCSVIMYVGLKIAEKIDRLNEK